MGTDGKNDGGFRHGDGDVPVHGDGAVPGHGDAPRHGHGDDDAPGADGEAAGRRDAAVRAAVEQGLLDPDRPLVALLDVTGIRRSAAALRAAFAAVTPPGTPVLHAFAVKAAPLVPVLRLLYAEGVGAEVASPGELALARAAGVPPRHTVLDSPAKTPGELREALALGLAVNVDNPQELARLDTLVPRSGTSSPLGLRVNPQVGAGSIEALSTATATSKFGVALRDEGARAWVVRAYLDRPWLTRLHAHTGSQGVALSLMARGVAEVYALAEEINRRAGRQQVDTLDIGGGLPVNFASDATDPTHAQYARLLSEAVPGLFDGRYGLVTEFGRSLLAKHGTVVARVEYAKRAGGRPVAVTHAGVQVATRTVYAPGRGRCGSPRTTPRAGRRRARPWCRTWRARPASRATCWLVSRRCPCSNRATTRRPWTPARTTSPTTTPTTRSPGPPSTASPPTAGAASPSPRSGARRPSRRSSPSRAAAPRTP